MVGSHQLTALDAETIDSLCASGTVRMDTEEAVLQWLAGG